MFKVDRSVPKIRILKRHKNQIQIQADRGTAQEVFKELKQSFNPTLFWIQ